MKMHKFLSWAEEQKKSRRQKLSDLVMEDILHEEGISTDLSSIEKFKNFKIPGAILEDMANLYIGRIAVGGKIFMTKNGLEFHSHKVFQNYDPVIIPFTSIQEVKLSKQFFFLNTSVTVMTKDAKHRFVIKNREGWKAAIEAALEIQ